MCDLCNYDLKKLRKLALRVFDVLKELLTENGIRWVGMCLSYGERSNPNVHLMVYKHNLMWTEAFYKQLFERLRRSGMKHTSIHSRGREFRHFEISVCPTIYI